MTYQDMEDAVGDLIEANARVITEILGYKMTGDQAAAIMGEAATKLATAIEARIDTKLSNMIAASTELEKV